MTMPGVMMSETSLGSIPASLTRRAVGGQWKVSDGVSDSAASKPTSLLDDAKAFYFFHRDAAFVLRLKDA